jgi:hypothetical protein
MSSVFAPNRVNEIVSVIHYEMQNVSKESKKLVSEIPRWSDVGQQVKLVYEEVLASRRM